LLVKAFFKYYSSPYFLLGETSRPKTTKIIIIIIIFTLKTKITFPSSHQTPKEISLS